MAPQPDGSEPIADAELIYRRVPVTTGWYDPAKGKLSPDAFHPRPTDGTGISVTRAKYESPQQAALGQPGKRYYLAVLAAELIRLQGMTIVPAPLPDQPGHAEIISLTFDTRKAPQSLLWVKSLAQKCCLRVEGPFPSDQEEQKESTP